MGIEMNRIISRSLATAGLLVILSCSGGNNPTIVPGPVPQDPKPETEKPEMQIVDVEFAHPCAYVNGDDIARASASVSAADASDPVYASWLSLLDSKFAQPSWRARAVETLVRGDCKDTGVQKENYIQADEDAAAAFQLALRWRIGGDEECAKSAVAILNNWSLVCRRITANDNNQYLLAGFQGHAFANAAELLRDYSGWLTADQDRFKQWLRDVWYEKNRWFLDNHGGPNNCPLHYWSNWELANMASIMAIGIYLEDVQMVSYVNHLFHYGDGSGALHNMIPFGAVADPDGKSPRLAQSMESGRDQGHATLVVSMCAELCRMAQNIGLDFWGAEDNLVLAMCEYTAKYNLKIGGEYICSTMPFSPYSYCMECSCTNRSHGTVHIAVSSASRGTLRPCWDLIYAHYVKETGLPASHAYYTRLFADQLRYVDGILTGDAGSGDSRYGTASGAYDQLGWGTLLFWQGD